MVCSLSHGVGHPSKCPQDCLDHQDPSPPWGVLSWHLQCTAEGNTDAQTYTQWVQSNYWGGSWEEEELSHIGAYYMSYLHNWSAHGPL